MTYEQCLHDAMRIHKLTAPDERCAHLARSMFKMKNKYAQHAEKKKAHAVVLIVEAPKHLVEMKHASNMCQSMTLKGKKCGFKATCGAFCKKHSVSKRDVVLGKKISV